MSSLAGLLLHAIGGFAAGSFYIPTKRVRGWAWESSWFVLGVAAWLLVPIAVAAATTPDLWRVLAKAAPDVRAYTYGFGVAWGIGGLTFGLALRYLGVSLGMAVALGLTAAFGTLVPPLYEGTLGALAATTAGAATLVGVGVCLAGIAVCGYAGVLRERAATQWDGRPAAEPVGGEGGLAAKPGDGAGQAGADQPSDPAADELDLRKGLLVALVSGTLSACFAFGLAAGGPISAAAEAAGAHPLFQNNATLVVILLGGLTTNGLYSLYLNARHRTFSDYRTPDKPLLGNYAWASLGGLTWYLQFFFYGMGETLLGERFAFASWTLHMAFIILSSTAWGLYYREWATAGDASRRMLWWGLGLIVGSTVLIGLGNAW